MRLAPSPSRRDFLRNAALVGAAASVGAWVPGCSARPSSAARACGPESDAAGGGVDAGGPGDAGLAADAAALDDAGRGVGLDLTDLPYRQDDPAWSGDLMWDRALVLQADMRLNGDTRAGAESLLRKFPEGNTIGNEGCQLTCFAMVLRLLAPEATPAWTPKRLNKAAQDAYYYTLCGLSMTTLYADLVAEMTNGRVQLVAKEEYLPGVAGWKRLDATTAPLVRAYRSLPLAKRRDLAVMVKTGTYDDTIASHYVLLDPTSTDTPETKDAALLDPAQPRDSQKRPWRLSDSAAAITVDPDIAKGWAASGITPTQLGGAWVFARVLPTTGRAAAAELIRAWGNELAEPR